MKLDILVFAAHPDDAELSCSGTIIKHTKLGKKVGIIDLTEGELGTRGSPQIRNKEAENAAKILGLTVRENLKFKDGYFKNDETHQLRVIEKLRQYQPDIVLCNAIFDRHPDHTHGSDLLKEASFYSGLKNIKSSLNSVEQNAWRPKQLYHYIQFYSHKPDFMVDISAEIDIKMESIKAFESQFYNPNSTEPETVIAGKNYLDQIKARDMEFGRLLGTHYAEGFNIIRPIGVNNLFDLI